MERKLTISQVAKLTGVTAKTIRYYEESGVIPAPARNESRYRLYSEADVRRLQLIRRARALDMPLAEVKELVEWSASATCNDFQGRFVEVVHRKLQEVDQRIADLESLRQDLRSLEAHLIASEQESRPDHTMLECSPDTCRCLGQSPGSQSHMQEVKLWRNPSQPES